MSDEAPKLKAPRKRSPDVANTGVLVEFIATPLPHDSPEFQARANAPRPERGPNRETATETAEEPKPVEQQPPAAK